MTIYTKAAWVADTAPCEGGMERADAALAALGYTRDTLLPMQELLAHLTLTDTLYGFVKVHKAGQHEANAVLGKYILHATGLAMRFAILPFPEYGVPMVTANRFLNAHYSGTDRRQALDRQYAALTKVQTHIDDLPMREWMQVYRHACSDIPRYLVAVHATQALLKGAAIIGFEPDLYDTLRNVLTDLLGPYNERHADDPRPN